MNKAIQSPTGENKDKIEGTETSMNGEITHNSAAQKGSRVCVVVTISVLGYFFVFTFLYYVFGVAMAISAFIPVIVVAWHYGLVPGIWIAVLSFPVNLLMYDLIGANWIDNMMLSGGGIPGTCGLILIGIVVGRIRDLNM